jgi:AraC-like DNA-binding protein/ligand-binding sensor protein
LTADKLNNPLLSNLCKLISDFLGIRFMVVFPTDSGWGQYSPCAGEGLPSFCRLVQAAPDGCKQCKMSHILMSIAACTNGISEQCCHAGTYVLAVPVTREHGNLALLSTCTFSHPDKKGGWLAAKRMGEGLGLDVAALKAAYDALPRLDVEQVKLAIALMSIGGEIVREIAERMRADATHEAAQLGGARDVRAKIESALRDLHPPPRFDDRGKGAKGRRRNVPVLIDVVCELVSQQPSEPFTVAAIAAAARVTPNHFSTLFRRYTRQRFTDFLADRRMELAKAYLRDLTLNVSQAAAKAGFEDPGYFARCFRKKVGMSPREWRCGLGRKPGKAPALLAEKK